MNSSNLSCREVGRIIKTKLMNIMNRFQLSKDNVSLCYKENCIHAKGSNANLIAIGAFAMLLLIGISTLSKTN